LQNNFLTAGEGNISYGKISGHQIGYIYISTFIGNNIEWSKDIDNVIQYLQDTKGIILDIRDNHGGYMENADNIASCFFERNVDYLKQKFRNGPNHSDFEPFQNCTLNIRENCKHYDNKTVVLTNRGTASASDRFNWLFKYYRNNNICIGDTTSGCFGQAFQYRVLPDGYIYSFSVSLVTSMEGRIALDSVGGTPPDILVLNNPMYNNIDSVMENAIRNIEQ